MQKKLILTYAGEKYVDAARRMLDIDKQLHKELDDIADGSTAG